MPAKDFWCEVCRRWTAPDEGAREEGRLLCSNCGEPYQCGECGYDIDKDGACQRPPDLDAGVVCPHSVIEVSP